MVIIVIFFQGTGLRAVFSSSKIATSNITVWWNPPNHDVNLVQSYNVSLRAFDSSYIFQTSVGLQTNYTFESYFPPGHLYFLEITSVVYLSDSAETIFVKTTTFNLVVGKKTYSYIKIFLTCNMIIRTWVLYMLCTTFNNMRFWL